MTQVKSCRELHGVRLSVARDGAGKLPTSTLAVDDLAPKRTNGSVITGRLTLQPAPPVEAS
jgi:hypothetical protein